MNFDKICIFHKHLRSSFGTKRKVLKKKFTEANFSNLVSYLLYAYQKKSTEKLLAKSILWAKLDMRILQRLALKAKSRLAEGGFNAGKFVSNSKKVMSQIKEKETLLENSCHGSQSITSKENSETVMEEDES